MNCVAADPELDFGPGAMAKSPERAQKLKKILGPDAPDAYFNKIDSDAKPWYLRPEFGAKHLWVNPEGGIRGGTLPALIERLTMHDNRGMLGGFAFRVVADKLGLIIDMGFNSTFLLTFKSFTTLDELFDGLVKRFYITPPANLSPNELKEWTEQKQVPVRFRYATPLVI